MTVRIDIDMTHITKGPHIREFYGRFAAECLREAQRLTAERVKSKGGPYARSFAFELAQGPNGEVLRFGNTSPHAIYVEEDTEAHDVRPAPPGRASFTNPDRAGALRWFDPPGGGADAAVFATEAHIPARHGKHIVRDAVKAAGDRLAGT